MREVFQQELREVQDRLVEISTLVAESIDRNEDDIRVVFLDCFITQSELVDHAGTEILDYDIGFFDKSPYGFKRLRVFEVDGDGAFVAVDAREHGAHAVDADT